MFDICIPRMFHSVADSSLLLVFGGVEFLARRMGEPMEVKDGGGRVVEIRYSFSS